MPIFIRLSDICIPNGWAGICYPPIPYFLPAVKTRGASPAKLKTVPLEKLEHQISKVIGELTEDRVECTIINFNAEEQCARLVITLDFGRDKRYSK